MLSSIQSPCQARARSSIVALGKLVVPNYRARLHWYHRQIAEALEGLLRFVRFRGKRGGYARVVLSLPPRHGKSLHAIELLPALAFGQDPSLKVMVATHTATLAKDGVNNTRQYMSHPTYAESFKTRIGAVESVDAEGNRSKVEATNAALMFRTLAPRRQGSAEYVDGGGYPWMS